jgi:uncharacterized membrane protein YdfJ with MMPL/SSD domain
VLVGPGAQLGVVPDGCVGQPRDLGVGLVPGRLVVEPRLDPLDDVARPTAIAGFLLIVGVIFGLAMDYQVFLVSRMHEEVSHGATPRDAVRDGFRHSARVVTAAGLIMISVFSGFILPSDPIIKSIGLAFAAGILIDAFLVRMTLIPALMTTLDRHAWWLPRRLDRVLPNVDIEGASLTQHPTVPAPRSDREAVTTRA